MQLLLNYRVWAAVTVAVMLAASHWKAYHLGGADVRLEWAADVLSQSEQANQLQTEAARVNAALQAKTNILIRTKNAKIAQLDTDLATALDGMRKRPARPSESDLSAATTVGAGSTGRELYKDDGEFLIRLAGRADKLRIDLAQCQAQYGSARAALNKD